MTAEQLVYLMLEAQNDFVAVYGRLAPQGGYMRNLDDLKMYTARWMPNASIGQVVDALIRSGHVVVIAAREMKRIFSATPDIQLPQAGLNILKNQLGLDGYKSIGYASRYDASPTPLDIDQIIGVKTEAT